MKIIDARGQVCPKPLIMAKKQLDEMSLGQEAVILIDNQTSKENVERYLQDNKVNFDSKLENGFFKIHFSRSQLAQMLPAESYCAIPSHDHTAVVISSDVMGRGDDQLGKILIQAFVNSLTEFPQIKSILFYNRGVFLATADSPVIATLQNLSKQGVKILVCGTCCDYFSIKNNIAVGAISNMYSILEQLNNSTKVISP